MLRICFVRLNNSEFSNHSYNSEITLAACQYFNVVVNKEKVKWQKTVLLSAIVTIIAIFIPLVALAVNFTPLQPIKANGIKSNYKFQEKELKCVKYIKVFQSLFCNRDPMIF